MKFTKADIHSLKSSIPINRKEKNDLEIKSVFDKFFEALNKNNVNVSKFTVYYNGETISMLDKAFEFYMNNIRKVDDTSHGYAHFIPLSDVFQDYNMTPVENSDYYIAFGYLIVVNLDDHLGKKLIKFLKESYKDIDEISLVLYANILTRSLMNEYDNETLFYVFKINDFILRCDDDSTLKEFSKKNKLKLNFTASDYIRSMNEFSLSLRFVFSMFNFPHLFIKNTMNMTKKEFLGFNDMFKIMAKESYVNNITSMYNDRTMATYKYIYQKDKMDLLYNNYSKHFNEVFAKVLDDKRYPVKTAARKSWEAIFSASTKSYRQSSMHDRSSKTNYWKFTVYDVILFEALDKYVDKGVSAVDFVGLLLAFSSMRNVVRSAGKYNELYELVMYCKDNFGSADLLFDLFIITMKDNYSTLPALSEWRKVLDFFYATDVDNLDSDISLVFTMFIDPEKVNVGRKNTGDTDRYRKKYNI